MIAGTLEIQLLANMARLQSDMDKAKRTVSGAADAMNKVLGTIGIGISLTGITNLIRSTADAADKMRDLKIASGLAIEQIGGLGKAAAMNGSNIDQVARAVGIMSQKMYSGADAFKVLGVEVKNSDGTLRDSGQVFLDISDKFDRMSDGATKSAVANEIFGKSGRDLIPTLNQGRGELEGLISAYAQHSGMTQKLADDSDKFNDILYLLGERVTGVKNSFVGELLPTLNAIGTAMLNAGQTTGQFSFAASVVVPVLKGLAIAGFTVADTFRGMGREIGARAAQLEALSRLDFKGMAFIGNALAEDNAKSRAEYDKLIDTILNGDKVIQKANVSQQKMLDIQVKIPATADTATKAIERQTKAYDIEVYKLKQYEDQYRKARDLTASVATDQERYNQKLKELNQLKPDVTIETYNRALEKAQKELKGTEVQTRQTTDEVSQLWMQAGRNIQSTLANSIFNFFDDGLKGMLKNVISTVGRIMSEFAALKIAQSIGLSSMFSMGTGAAAAGSTGGASLLSNVGSGAGIMSMLKGGMGGISSGISGMMGGGGIGAFALPIAGAFALNSMSNAFAGDKTLGNGFTDFMQKIPILGAGWDILAGFFGREPYKFRQQSIQGTAGSGGFVGDINNVYRSQGGVFSGNKHKDQKEEFSKEQQAIFDTAITGFYKSAHDFAENLGFSTDLVDNFTKEVQIKSEKGKTVTEEAIAEMIAGIGDSLAKNVLPNVEDFRNAGEKSFDTFARLNNEFEALSTAAIILGKSVSESRAFIVGATFDGRSAFIEAAGGIDALNQKAAMFTQNFLTESERLAPVQESLNEQLTKLGLSTSLSKDQFRDLVQSFGKVNGISEETLQALLNLQGGFLLIRNGTESMLSNLRATAKERIESAKADKIASAESAFAALQRSVDAERTRITDEYNAAVKISDERIKSVTESVNNLTQFSNTLKSTIASISPMSLLSARAIASSAIQTGNIDPSSLSNVVSILGGSLDPSKFKDRNALMRGQGQNAGLLSGLSSETDAQLLLAQRSLDALEASRQLLDDGFKNQMTGLDSILTNAQEQLDALKGIDKSIMSLSDAIMQMTAAAQGGGGGSGGGGVFVGGSDVSAADIKDFFTLPRTALEIATAAAEHNLSSGEIAGAAGFSQATVDEFFASNPNIPHFAKGTSSVPRTGPAYIHAKERIINPEQNADIVDSLKSLVDMVAAGTIASNDLYRLLRDAMQETSTGLAINTKAAA